MASSLSYLYLGDLSADPAPIFRDLSPRGVTLEDGTTVAWPADATFAIQFTAGRFPGSHMIEPRPAPVTFFDLTGWPIDLPAHRRQALSADMKHEFQVEPHAWRHWSTETWETAIKDPAWFAHLREQTGLVHAALRTINPPV